ncbi:hypothetical protein JCGZ_03826 [Jatropha curcas]|uniref:Secreted protein n=1 Tax=Jatropha curcas TaxID=180498 RepID=A0A067JNI6_JATCU|nr:hypothetical protein JCGZ_03826 [Jatropha curcas]
MLLLSGICWTLLCELGLSLQVSGITPPDCAAHSLVSRYAICIDGAVERLHAHFRVRVWRDDPHTRGLCCYHRLTLHWSGSSTRRSIPDSCYRSPAISFPPRCHDADPIHRAGVHVLRDSLSVLGARGSGPGWRLGESCRRMSDLLLLRILARRGTRLLGPSCSTSFLHSYYAPPRIRGILQCWRVFGI